MLAQAHKRFRLGPRHANAGLLGQHVHHQKTQVVRRPGVFDAGIAEANDQAHPYTRRTGSRSIAATASRWRALLLLFLLGRGSFFAFFSLFGFLLALLDDFGLGRSCGFGGDGFGRLLFLDAQSDDVRTARAWDR